MLGMRVLFMLLSVACVWRVSTWLGRDRLRSRLSGLAAAATLLSFEGFTTYATVRSSREDHDGAAACRSPCCPRSPHDGSTAGVSASRWPRSPGSRRSSPHVAAATVAILAGPPVARLRALGRVVLGGLIPSVATVAAYAAVGAAPGVPGRLRPHQRRATPSRARCSTTPPDRAGRWSEGYGWTLALVVLGSPAADGLRRAGPRARRRLATDHRHAALAGRGALRGRRGCSGRSAPSTRWPDAMVILPAAGTGPRGRGRAHARPPDAPASVASRRIVLPWWSPRALAVGYVGRDSRTPRSTDQRGVGRRRCSTLVPADATSSRSRPRSRWCSTSADQPDLATRCSATGCSTTSTTPGPAASTGYGRRIGPSRGRRSSRWERTRLPVAAADHRR